MHNGELVRKKGHHPYPGKLVNKQEQTVQFAFYVFRWSVCCDEHPEVIHIYSHNSILVSEIDSHMYFIYSTI